LLPLMAIALAGCATTTPVSENAAVIDLDFSWSDRSGCSRISPTIRLNNVPSETRYLKFKMFDSTARKEHGGGQVTYRGNNLISEGALQSYSGPCPRSSKVSRNRYRITVEALNENKDLVLGKGSNHRVYPER
jgi:phosphatidylethanolamine-binding protein (PEBP) family uncharacterized protein